MILNLLGPQAAGFAALVVVGLRFLLDSLGLAGHCFRSALRTHFVNFARTGFLGCRRPDFHLLQIVVVLAVPLQFPYCRLHLRDRILARW